MAWCQCAVCEKEFKSVYSFDTHRVGKYTIPDTRRCLTDKELKKLGMIEKDGVWITAEMPLRALVSKKLAKKK